MATRYNEYTGFIPARNPLDWAKITGGLVDTITKIGEEREAERQALDKLATDNAEIIQNTELGKTQTYDQLILAGSDKARNKLFEWNRQLKAGEIKPAQYKNLINNLKSSWSTFANTTKTFDQQMQEALRRQQEGLGSALELELNNKVAQLANLRNKVTDIDNNTGSFIIGELGENGLFDPSTIMDLRSVGKPGNIIDNKVDLDAIVDEKTKNIASWIKETGRTTTTDPLLNEATDRMIYDLSKAILNNPRAITSVLTDNTDGNYDFYSSTKELDAKIQDRVSKENEFRKQNNKSTLSGDDLTKFINGEKDKFIFLAQDDQGVYQPNPTNSQIKKANDATIDRIKSRLERKVELDEPQYRSSGGDDSTKTDNFAVATYISANKALDDGDFSNLDNDQYNFKGGVDKDGKKYVLVSRRAYDKKSGTYYDDPQAKQVRVYRSDALVQYMKGMENKNSVSIYNSGKDDFFKLNKYTLEGTYEADKNDKAKIPSASRAEWKKSGWTDAQINQAVKEGKIKVI
jgi:hypothetical protein